MIRESRELFWGLALSLLLGWLSGCDRLHEPAIYNGFDSEVELRVTWEDGRRSSGTVPPLEIVHVGHPDSRVAKVEVLKDGEILTIITGTEIEKFATEMDQDVAGIVIEEGGVRALTEEELKRLDAE